MTQQKFVHIGDGLVSVTPNYIFAMLQFAAREGWFIDSTSSNGQDHDFDCNEPTPGAHWQEARALRQAARKTAALAEFVSGRTKTQFVREARSLSNEATRLARKLT